MLGFLFMAHSGWRYIVILALVAVLVRILIGLSGRSSWSSLDRRLGAIAAISVDIQWLLGIILWVLQIQRWTAAPGYVGAFEHPFTMTLGLVALHVFWGRAKKAELDATRYRMAFMAFGLSSLLIGLGIWRITGG